MIDSKGPTKEKTSDSQAIVSSVYHFCNITYNDVLIKKWLNNEVISTK